MKSSRLFFFVCAFLTACGAGIEPIAQTQTSVALQQSQLQLTQVALSLGVTQTALVREQERLSTNIAATQNRAARPYITRNADWTPIERNIDGVPMVLVPAGCFQMGNDPNAYNGRETDGGEQCFDEFFWIDKYEVSQAQFNRFGGTKANVNRFTGDDLPVENITWFEARDFCALRAERLGAEMRLPTEAEWEYAARGVDELDYPWGNDFMKDNVVYGENSNSRTATIGSRPTGRSWVGAMDLSGNVWEWINSLYRNYPYATGDGRENAINRTDARVLRGGSWSDNVAVLRMAYRLNRVPDGVNNFIGFRCVRL